jgi:AcrR family transcriptional regulator
MPKTTPLHASEMRHRILDGAHRAMLAGGYRGTTMPAIATEAGVSVGLLYRYFPSKAELYLAMCEEVNAATLDALAQQLAQIHDPAERLAGAISLFTQGLADERWGPIVTTGWTEADVNPRLRDLLLRRCDQLRGFAASFLREAIVRGDVDPDLDVDRLSNAAAIVLDGVIAHQAELGDRFDPAEVAQAIITLFGRAMAPSRMAPSPTG